MSSLPGVPKKEPKLKKALRLALERKLADGLPAALGDEYRRLKPLPKGDAHFVLSGEIVYADTSRPVARLVSFIPSPKDHAFTVELGWSATGDFPCTTSRPSVHFDTEISELPDEGFIRLSKIYSPLDEDWDLAPSTFEDPDSFRRFIELDARTLNPDAALSLVSPLVDDFFGALDLRVLDSR